MCITTVTAINYITYELYIEKPMQMVELKWKSVLHKSPHLIKKLDKNSIYPLIINCP